MQVKILKGTNQIGGVFTEIASKEAKIMIDFGDDTSTESLDKTENETFDKDLSVDEFDANSLFGDNDFFFNMSYR